MSARPTPNGPYRTAPRPAPRPASPDIDPALFAPSRGTHALTYVGVWGALWLVLTWFTEMSVRGCGPTHTETLGEKIATTVVVALLFAALAAVRVRHGLRQRAAYRAILAEPDPTAHASEELPDEGEPSPDRRRA